MTAEIFQSFAPSVTRAGSRLVGLGKEHSYSQQVECTEPQRKVPVSFDWDGNAIGRGYGLEPARGTLLIQTVPLL